MQQTDSYGAGLSQDARVELLIGHLQETLAKTYDVLGSIETRRNHVILRDDLRFLQRQVWASLEDVRRLTDSASFYFGGGHA